MIDLLPCPVCGSDPKTTCVIKATRGRETVSRPTLSLSGEVGRTYGKQLCQPSA
jgi:hypothetical protein